jgi:hypothetical protein
MPVYLPPDDILTGKWGPTPAELTLTPAFTRANDMGGPDVAEIEVRGPALALEETLDWLRRLVFVRNEHGMDVWWGYVNEVRLSAGASTYTVSLDDVANRVAVAYAAPTADGASERQTTPWAEDAQSVARYGVKELLDSAGTAYTAAALGRRTTLLNDLANASAAPSLGGDGESRALLVCVGWMESLRWRMFRRLEGRLEFEGETGRVQPIGWSIAGSNQVGFGDGAIHDAWGRLGGLPAGARVTVIGSVGNNKSFTVAEGTAEEVESYVNNTISFQPSDDIFDSADGLGKFKADHWLLVTGSAANSRWHRIGSAGDDHLRTSAGVSGAISAETTGPTIGLYQAQRLPTREAAVFEAPGAAAGVSVLLTGHVLAQSFVLPNAMDVAQVAIQLAKTGAPADDFVIQVRADASGAPGAVLATGALATADVGESLAWRWVTLPLTTLAAGTYWLTCTRAGAASAVNFYRVQLSPTAYGTCLAWTGSAWVANPLGEYLPFRVWAGEDTASQMRRVVADCGQFLAAIDAPAATGIVTNPYRDEDETALDALFKLLDSGTAAGERLLAQVTPQRVLQIFTTAPGGDVLLWGGDGVLRQAAGGRLPRGYLPVGEWVRPEGLSEATRAALRVAPVLIEEAEYDWGAGELRINRVRKMPGGLRGERVA